MINISLWKRIWGSIWTVPLLVVESSFKKEPRVIACFFSFTRLICDRFVLHWFKDFCPHFYFLISICRFMCNYIQNYVAKRFVGVNKGVSCCTKCDNLCPLLSLFILAWGASTCCSLVWCVVPVKSCIDWLISYKKRVNPDLIRLRDIMTDLPSISHFCV